MGNNSGKTLRGLSNYISEYANGITGNFMDGFEENRDNKLPIIENSENMTEEEKNSEIVKAKLTKAGYSQRMTPNNFEAISRCFSSEDELTRRYFHDNVEKVKRLKKIMELRKKLSTEPLELNLPERTKEWDNSNEKKKKEEEETEGEEEEPELSSRETIEEEESRKRKGYERELEELEKRNNVMKIRLIVSHSSRHEWFDKIVLNILGQVTNKGKQMFDSYGDYSLSLGLGPWRLDWNWYSGTIPRVITSKATVLCADVMEIHSYEDFETVRRIAVETMVKYNTKMRYQANGYSEKKIDERSDTNFVEELLDLFPLPFNLPFPVTRFLETTRRKGIVNMIFDVEEEEEFRKKFDLVGNTKGVIRFKTHRELDTFVINHLLREDPHFDKNFPGEYHLLKSFDRAFWMRKMYYQRLRTNLTDNDLKNMTIAEPLFSGEEEEEGERRILKCPFGDPFVNQEFTFFRVQ